MNSTLESSFCDLVLKCENLKKIFTEGPANVEVLNNISLKVSKGEQVVIIGLSGSGKSTLLHLFKNRKNRVREQYFLI